MVMVRYLNRKRAAFEKATCTGKPSDWESFKKLRTKVKRLIRQHKLTYISRKLGNRRYDPRKFWQEMGRNLRLGKHTPRKGLFNIVDNTGNMLDGKMAADYINQYYTNVGDTLSVKFKDVWVESEFFEALNKTGFSFGFITENVIKNILHALPTNKSSCIEFLVLRCYVMG